MQETKLVQLLRTFRTRDFRRLREYLASPFFNKRQDLIQFYQAVEAFAPGFENMTKSELWEVFSPGEPVSDKELGYLSNFLLKAAENYLAQEAWEEDEVGKGVRVLNYYLERGMDKHYRSVQARIHKVLEQEPYREADWHLKAWQLANADLQYFYSSRTRKPDGSLARAARHLDGFYLDKKLELSSEALNLNQILQAGLDTSFIDELLVFLDTQEKTEPTVRVRRMVLEILRAGEDAEAFNQLKACLPEAVEIFPPEKAQGIFSYAQNYCIRRIKSGDREFQRELFQIYEFGLKAGLLMDDDELSPWKFKNVVTIALRLQEFKWAEEFIDSYQGWVNPKFRKNAVAYNQANIEFHRKIYDRALRLLLEVEYSDIFYALDTRRMMVMIYFEQQEWEALDSLISSFRIFLHRNKIISEQNLLAYKHFVDWVARIMRAMHKHRWELLSDYEGQIASVNPIVEGEWLRSICRKFHPDHSSRI